MTRRRTALAVLPLLLTAACTAGGGTDAGSFAAEGDTALTCIRHQMSTPGPAYTGGDHADTSRILQMLRYYTTNGRKPFCDGKPPTGTDRRWATLYVELGADRANVAPLLDPA